MKNINSVLITGATGAVGPRIVSAFHEAGFKIRTLSLDPPPKNDWPSGIDSRTGDIRNESAVKDAMQGIDSVVHLAALLHIVNPPENTRNKYEQINVGGTSTVVSAAANAGVKRIVFFSTISVYGPSSGRILNEESPPKPDSFYARTKLEAERIVLDAKGLDGEKIGSVLRMGAIYGSKIKGNYQRLLYSLDKGRFIPIGSGVNRRTLIYDKDAGRAAVLCVSNDAAAGEIYNVSDGGFHTMDEIISAICLALGREKPKFSLPVNFIKYVVGFIDDSARHIGIKSPITRAVFNKYIEDTAVEAEKIKVELGFDPIYDLYAGWKETVEYMKEMGEVSHR